MKSKTQLIRQPILKTAKMIFFYPTTLYKMCNESERLTTFIQNMLRTFMKRRGRRDRHLMVVRFTTTYAVSVYHH